MSDNSEFLIPSYAELEAADPHAFAIWNGPDAPTPVERVQLDRGVALSARFECFLAFFAVPAGVTPQQGVYRLLGPDQKHWDLLMTPVQPEPDGRHVLQVVIHREQPALTASGV
ncbi:hypothetical protein DCO48_20010 [Pseudomonas sp. SDI]|uniref:DUF6916 family protein n=1 Tax=Pseudomonas sp. SDI TaxID=2170734 RepID=UPI000DE6D88D|nr:hypothetical protein [Pseudomonas sp. SDI]PWB30532.1 hypothetical protein DCO48_20010 [Pseudomonas sp. SDI]